MRKFKNIILIALMFCSIFGVLEFVPVGAVSTNLITNSTFDVNSNGWACTKVVVSGGALVGQDANPGSAVYPTFEGDLDVSKVQTIYFDFNANSFYRGFRLYVSNGGLKTYTISLRGDPTYPTSEFGGSIIRAGIDLSALNGMSLEEIYNTYKGTGVNAVAWSERTKYQIIFDMSNSGDTLDNVYIWQNTEKVAADGSPLPTCGDGTCNGTETCATCPVDCGSCYSGTVTHTLAPSSVLKGETVNGVVILTDGLSRQKPTSVTLTVNGAALTTTSAATTNDENFTHYAFTPLANNLDSGDHVVTAVANYGGTDYTGTATLTVLAPGEGTAPINPGDEMSKTVDGIKFTFNFTKDNYELNEFGTFLKADYVKVDTWLSPQVKYYLSVSTPDGQAGGGFTNYEVNPNNAIIKVGANPGTMAASARVLYRTMYGVGDWKEITLTDSATVGNVSNNPGAITDSQKSLLTKIAETPGKIVQGAANVAAGAVSTVKKALGTTYETAKDVASDVYDGGKTVVSDVANALKNPVNTVAKTVSNAGKAVGSAVSDILGGASSGSSILAPLKGTLFGVPIWMIAIGGIFAFFILSKND